MYVMQSRGTESNPGWSAIEALRIPDANRRLGELRIRFHDHEDGMVFSTRTQAVSGARVGDDRGYADLRTAMGAIALLTAGDAPAAAVLLRDGRFFGHVLKGRDVERGIGSPLRPLHLEPDAVASVLALRAANRFERLAAVVDGGWSHRFRS